MSRDLRSIIDDYKKDGETVYNSWFVNNEERLKAFRSIRRGVLEVIQDIKNGNFGNDFKGSSLERVCFKLQHELSGHPIVPCQAKNTFQETSFKIKQLYNLTKIQT